MSKKVITIHGINTRGGWQDSIKTALEPHFECIAIKYRDYRWLGETKILLDPFTLLIGLVRFWGQFHFGKIPPTNLPPKVSALAQF
jgi:hypothetical protein